MIETARWIWLDKEPENNEYARFTVPFVWGGAPVTLFLAAETDYVACVNGKQVGFGQFAGWRDEKYYDTLDITGACRPGDNLLTVTVRYEGVDSLTHIEDGAGLLFSVESAGEILAQSGAHTEGALDGDYIQHRGQQITRQLGLSAWMTARGETVPFPVRETGRVCRLSPRPVKKTELCEPVWGTPVMRLADGNTVFDLGRETAGYLLLEASCGADTGVEVRYGEHLTDYRVRYRIHNRDFSLRFDCAAGENSFLQPFVRVAGRYLEVAADAPLDRLKVGLLPALYPLTEKEPPAAVTGRDRAIWDTCVRTLRLCMNTHYEDCPWREQALYVLDSRNQMLCGYDAFEEAEFARACLAFMAKGGRGDGFLELTYPAVNTPAIPFFSVMYPVAVWEYVQRTGDRTLIGETMETMRGIMEAMAARIAENGLVANLPAPYWNFYEWSEGSDNGREIGGEGERPARYDLILNCAFVYAGTRYQKLCELAGLPCPLPLDALKKSIEKAFYCPDTGLFRASTAAPDLFTELGCAMALLIGLGDGRTSAALKGDARLVTATLSMRGYVYDALLAENPDNAAWVLEDLRTIYGHMLDRKATSFWETVKGEADFDGAGSLCHGWSAMPIHYFARFAAEGRLN